MFKGIAKIAGGVVLIVIPEPATTAGGWLMVASGLADVGGSLDEN